MDWITKSIMHDSTPEGLLELHNAIPGVRPLTRAGDWSTAAARLRLALERAGCKLARTPGLPGVYRVLPKDAISHVSGRARLQLRIRLLASENPKRPGTASHARFALYRDGMTIQEYKDALAAIGQNPDVALPDIYHDRRKGWIKTEDPALP